VQQPGVDRTRPGLQFGEIADAALAAEVIGRVHHGLDPQRAALLQVLFHPGMAPEGVDGHAIAAAVDRGLERPAGALVFGLAAPRVAFEQHLDVLRAAQVQVVGDERLEERPGLPWRVEHDDPGYLDLPQRQFPPVPGRPVVCGQRQRDA